MVHPRVRALVPAAAAPTLRRVRLGATFLRPRAHLFLFSHMRSYSSVLGHILGSNPEIDGYSELQLSYTSELDLIRASLRVYETNGNKLRGRYVFDKVLHGHLKVGGVVLSRPKAKAIFVVREPEATIKSTVAMAQRKANPGWKGDIDKVAGYYARRVGQLVELAEAMKGPTCVFEAEALMDRSDEVLAGLTAFLGLKQPLSSDYDKFSHTGKARFGDPGQHISSGTLVTERSSHDDIVIEPALIADLERTRLDAVARLRATCNVSL